MPASFRQGSRPCSPMRVRVSSHRGKVTEPGFMQHMSAHDVPNSASGRSRRSCHRSDALPQTRPCKSRRRSPSTTSVVPHILRDMSSHRIQVALPASVGRLPCRMVFEACRGLTCPCLLPMEIWAGYRLRGLMRNLLGSRLPASALARRLRQILRPQGGLDSGQLPISSKHRLSTSVRESFRRS